MPQAYCQSPVCTPEPRELPDRRATRAPPGRGRTGRTSPPTRSCSAEAPRRRRLCLRALRQAAPLGLPSERRAGDASGGSTTAMRPSTGRTTRAAPSPSRAAARARSPRSTGRSTNTTCGWPSGARATTPQPFAGSENVTIGPTRPSTTRRPGAPRRRSNFIERPCRRRPAVDVLGQLLRPAPPVRPAARPISSATSTGSTRSRCRTTRRASSTASRSSSGSTMRAPTAAMPGCRSTR